MRPGSPCPLWRREQRFQPAPDHVDQRWRRRCSLLRRRRHLPPAGGNDNSVPRRGATGATATRARYASRSSGPEPTVRFEAGQTGHRHPVSPFLGRHVGPHFGPHDRQKRLRPHGQCHMAIPSRPTADLIMIQPDLAFGGLETFFDRPAHASHAGCLATSILHQPGPRSLVISIFVHSRAQPSH
jgi:hypothetical protein